MYVAKLGVRVIVFDASRRRLRLRRTLFADDSSASSIIAGSNKPEVSKESELSTCGTGITSECDFENGVRPRRARMRQKQDAVAATLALE
mmetsp:Transcript_3819/g.8340  ORF Transcript_3819/g.8340 Transcript_3819/m.8340 type:complete len:90 (+) Transcript_3819:1072-1341(+)